jgi:hypothetical protein
MWTRLAIILLAAIAIQGCNPSTSNLNQNSNTNSNANNANANRLSSLKPPDPVKPAGPVDPNFKPCNVFFPLVPGSQAKYTVRFSSSLIADATVVVDAAEEGGRKVFTETTQIVDRSGGMQKAETAVRKYVCDGERVQIISDQTNNRIEDRQHLVTAKFATVSTAMPETASLLRQGSTWAYSFHQTYETAGEPPRSPNEPITINFEVQGEEEVTTPVGKFKAIKILRRVGEARLTDYYARGVGLVKRVNVEGTNWELKEFAGLKPLD